MNLKQRQKKELQEAIKECYDFFMDSLSDNESDGSSHSSNRRIVINACMTYTGCSIQEYLDATGESYFFNRKMNTIENMVMKKILSYFIETKKES